VKGRWFLVSAGAERESPLPWSRAGWCAGSFSWGEGRMGNGLISDQKGLIIRDGPHGGLYFEPTNRTFPFSASSAESVGHGMFLLPPRAYSIIMLCLRFG